MHSVVEAAICRFPSIWAPTYSLSKTEMVSSLGWIDA